MLKMAMTRYAVYEALPGMSLPGVLRQSTLHIITPPHQYTARDAAPLAMTHEIIAACEYKCRESSLFRNRRRYLIGLRRLTSLLLPHHSHERPSCHERRLMAAADSVT